MKQSTLKIIAATICILISTTCSAKKIFKELASDPNVESVYVGKAMMFLTKGSIRLSGDNDAKTVTNAIKHINSIELISCDKPNAFAEVKAKARKIIAKLKLETLLETHERNENTFIYGIVPTNNKSSYISDMVIENIETGEYSLIHVNGKIDLAALMKETE